MYTLEECNKMEQNDSDSSMKQVREIFTKAREMPAGPDRDAYLDKACGENIAIREEVEDLLRVAEKSGDFLKDDVAGHFVQEPHDMIGTEIGPYQITGLLGHGGFGDVYRVEQMEPIHRELAMKILKLGMNSEEVMKRFLMEREALAMMNHPHIARILDAGTTADGRPYFVMDLVLGTPITTYCDKHKLSLEKRLQLFRKVCSAVQHAHQKGVIHRDLKPSNIVVVDEDKEASVKVIDFGIAKVINEGVLDQPIATQAGFFIGTPVYMSPEQISMSSDSLDTRADIYSLGVLLYELIAGVKPFESDTLQRAALAEIQRIICEVYPEKPSVRIRKIKDKATELAKHRSIDTLTLVRTIRGDLDWIVMKAIDKDRSRRYQGVGELATDIERHLQHQPVHAAAPGAIYRLKKFIRRHRLGTAMVAMLLLVILVGLVTSMIGFAQAKKERDRALVAEFISQAENAKSLTFREHLLTLLVGEQESRDYLVNLNQIFGGMEGGKDISGKELVEQLNSISARIDKVLINDPLLMAKTYGLLGDSYISMGLKAEAWENYDKMTQALAQLNGSKSIAYADGLVRYAQSVNHGYYGQLTLEGSGYPNHFDYQLVKKGREREIDLLERAMSIYNSRSHLSDTVIAALLQLGGALPKARRSEKEARLLELVETARELYGVDSFLTKLYEKPYWLYLVDTDQLEKARPYWEKLADEHPLWDDGPYWYPFTGTSGLGMIYEKEGDFENAEKIYRENIAYIESKTRGEFTTLYQNYLKKLMRLLNRTGTSDEELNRKIDLIDFRRGFDPSKSRVNYNLKINHPGTYRLYLRWNGLSDFSNAVVVRIRNLQDGFQGDIADFYGFSKMKRNGDNYNSLSPDWRHLALFEKPVKWMPKHQFVEAEWKFEEAGEYILQIMESKSRAAVDAFVLQLNTLPDPESVDLEPSQMDENRCYHEVDGRIVVEAEDFSNRQNGRVTEWKVIPDEMKPSPNLPGYSGRGYLHVIPEMEWWYRFEYDYSDE